VVYRTQAGTGMLWPSINQSRQSRRQLVRLRRCVVAWLGILALSGCHGMGSAIAERPDTPVDLTQSGPESEVVSGDHSSSVTDKTSLMRSQLQADIREFGPMMLDDARSLGGTRTVATLGLALGGALALRDELDDRVRENTRRNPGRWGEASEVLGGFGNPEYQIPVLLAVYARGLTHGDETFRDFNRALLSAYAINGLSTVAIKGIANTERPSDDYNGGRYGFPSFHTSSTFTLATVLDEYYGPQAGLPAYALAGLVGWSRIDERDHDLSDVVFGAALGYVIGRSVARNHLLNSSGVRVTPSASPVDGTMQILFDVPF